MGAAAKDSADFKSVEEVFDVIEAALQRDGKDLVKKARGIFNFVVTKSGGQQVSWIVDAKNGSGSVTKDGKGPSDVTITMADSDFIRLVQGQLNAQKAFFQGLLKIKGNMGLAMKLPDFLKDAQKIKSKL